MKFFTKSTKYAFFDHKRNQDVLEELKNNQFWYELTAATKKWIQGVSRTDRSRIVQAVRKYLPAVVGGGGGGDKTPIKEAFGV